jgi:hypothetical protein
MARVFNKLIEEIGVVKATKGKVVILNRLEWKRGAVMAIKGNKIMTKGSLGRMQVIMAEICINILHEINLFFTPKEQDVAMAAF